MEPQLKHRRRRSIRMKLARLIIVTLPHWRLALRRSGCVLLIGLMLGGIANPANANEVNHQDDGVSFLIGVLRGHVDRAVLYIAPYRGAITSNPKIEETDLPSLGCKYEIGPEGTDELIEILKQDRIHTIGPEAANPVVDARTAVFIYMNKKRLMTMLILADPLPGEDSMRGVWNRGSAVITGPQLAAKLSAFARKQTPSGTYSGCAKN